MNLGDVVLLVELGLIVLAAPFALPEAIYLWRLRRGVPAGEGLWLLTVLGVTVWALTAAAIYFGLLVAARLVFGSDAIDWTRPLSGLVIVAILAVPIYIGRAMRGRRGPAR